MKLFYMIVLLIVSRIFLNAQSFSDFDHFQGRFIHQEIESKIKKYLQKDHELDDYIELTPEAFYLYQSKEDKIQNKAEYVLNLSKTTQSHSQLNPFPKSLSGLRIAIDPGHVGGCCAKLEKRWVYMSTTKPKDAHETILFKEGTLALLTALRLKEWLEADGAHVLLTKENDGQSVYPQTFFEWLAEEGYHYTLSPTDLFRNYYNRLDLEARAEKINAFHPHVTLIIHYNAHGQRDPITQETPPQSYNYNMTFVGGSFCRGELESMRNRYEFLRLLLTDDLAHSIDLSKEVISQFTQYLEVPPVRDEDRLSYLNNTAIKIDEGVYARNLFLTRCIHGPICYGESLCQDHEKECIYLNQKDLRIKNSIGPSRVEKVAKAYYEALRSFLSTH